jgi:hypothetical protein
VTTAASATSAASAIGLDIVALAFGVGTIADPFAMTRRGSNT